MFDLKKIKLKLVCGKMCGQIISIVWSNNLTTHFATTGSILGDIVGENLLVTASMVRPPMGWVVDIHPHPGADLLRGPWGSGPPPMISPYIGSTEIFCCLSDPLLDPLSGLDTTPPPGPLIKNLADKIIWPHILLQTGSILGDIVSKNKQFTGSVTNGICSRPS